MNLHERLLQLVRLERRITSKIIDTLQEVEDKRLYVSWGYANLFTYLVRGLGYSESLAYQRQAALKICRALPEVKNKIDEGSLSLTTLARANKILHTKTTEEKRQLLKELENKPTREVDRILARLHPAEKNYAPAKRYVSEQTIRITIDIQEEDYEKLEQLKALKSHQVNNYQELITLLVDRELAKHNQTSTKPSKSKNPRQIKISTKNYLLKKANYRCQHPGCMQTHYLQVDHIKSVHKGGSNHPANLQILCQSHNRHKYETHG